MDFQDTLGQNGDKINYKSILEIVEEQLYKLNGKVLDIFEIHQPPTDLSLAIHLFKIISKFSPLVANMVEYYAVEKLNKLDWKNNGKWIRQDPGFPDILFDGVIQPKPGFEIKTWFPMATEITARFRDSVTSFEMDQTYVCLVAWLPEHILYGKLKIIDIWIGSAQSLAKARDAHYHNPPDYLIFEPEDTSSRTINLQQSNTNGYKFQGTPKQFEEAKKIMDSWEGESIKYSHSRDYQNNLKSLLQFPYRLDTNYSKLDRIQHSELEEFKDKVLNTSINGYKISEWSKIIGKDKKYANKLLKNLI